MQTHAGSRKNTCRKTGDEGFGVFSGSSRRRKPVENGARGRTVPMGRRRREVSYAAIAQRGSNGRASRQLETQQAHLGMRDRDMKACDRDNDMHDRSVNASCGRHSSCGGAKLKACDDTSATDGPDVAMIQKGAVRKLEKRSAPMVLPAVAAQEIPQPDHVLCSGIGALRCSQGPKAHGM